MKYITRNGSNPQGLPKVYFTGHPEDCKHYLNSISEDILKLQNCAVFYDENPEYPENMELFFSDLEQMQLIVIVVSKRFVSEDTFAFRTVFRHAMEAHIPVLPILEEAGIEDDFNKKCGGLQFLNPHSTDLTEISYEDKLKKYLDSVLVGDELAEKVRSAFDAYVFLSYRKKDRKYAQKLMRLIHQNDFCRDIAIWYDEFLVPGENFNDAIQKAMEKSKLFALTVTPNLMENPNYVMTTEYPAAKNSGKPIIPVTLAATEKKDLQAHYEGIPDPVDSTDTPRLSQALLDAIGALDHPKNNNDPQHVFFIGLAYLSGIDVEVDHERALELITFSAEHEQPEAMQKLAAMYQNGEGVMTCPEISMLWQKRLADVYQKAYEAKHTEDNCKAWLQALLQFGETMVNYCTDVHNYEYALETVKRLLTMAEAADRISRNDWTKHLIASLCSISSKVCMNSYYHSLRKIPGTVSSEDDTVKILMEARQYLEHAVTIREELIARNTSVNFQQELIESYEYLAKVSILLMKDTHSKALGKDAEMYQKKKIKMQEYLADNSISALKNLKHSYEQLNVLCRQLSLLDLPKQIEAMHHVIALQESIVEKEPSSESRAELCHVYVELARLYLNHKEYAKARETFEACLALHPQLIAESGVSFKRVLTVKKGISLQHILTVYHSLIRICRATNAVSDAEFYETVLKETEEMFRLEEEKAEEARKAESKLEVIPVSHDRIFQKRQTPEYIEKAVKSAEDCLSYYQENTALANSPKALQKQASAYKTLGAVHFLEKEYAEAKAYYEKSLELYEQAAALTDIPSSLRWLAEACEKLKDYETAKRCYQKLIVLGEKPQTSTRGSRGSQYYHKLEWVCKALGDAAGIAYCQEKIQQTHNQYLQKRAYNVFLNLQGNHLIIRKNLGYICQLQGDAAAAKAHYEAAYAICQTMLEKYPYQKEYQALLAELQELR